MNESGRHKFRKMFNFSSQNLIILIKLNLIQASSFGETELQEKCLGMIDKYVLEAFESTSFTELTRNSLQMVMRRDTLEVEELDVFDKCIRWAEAECQRLPLR